MVVTEILDGELLLRAVLSVCFQTSKLSRKILELKKNCQNKQQVSGNPLVNILGSSVLGAPSVPSQREAANNTSNWSQWAGELDIPSPHPQ